MGGLASFHKKRIGVCDVEKKFSGLGSKGDNLSHRRGDRAGDRVCLRLGTLLHVEKKAPKINRKKQGSTRSHSTGRLEGDKTASLLRAPNKKV